MSNNLPPGYFPSHEVIEAVRCPICGNRWELRTRTCMGICEVVGGSYACDWCGAEREDDKHWFADIVCPACGEPGQWRIDVDSGGQCPRCGLFFDLDDLLVSRHMDI